MRTSCFSTKLTVLPACNREHDVDVWYVYHAASIGKTDGKYGPKLEPDEDAEIEIEAITLSGVGAKGRDIQALFCADSVIEKIFDYLNDEKNDYDDSDDGREDDKDYYP